MSSTSAETSPSLPLRLMKPAAPGFAASGAKAENAWSLPQRTSRVGRLERTSAGGHTVSRA